MIKNIYQTTTSSKFVQIGVAFTLDLSYPHEFESGYPNKISSLIKLVHIAIWYSVNGFIRINFIQIHCEVNFDPQRGFFNGGQSNS